MYMKKLFTLIALVFTCWYSATAATPILGSPVASTDRMYQYVKSKNPGSSFTYEMAQTFHDIGAKWGVRGDIALCQSCIETGWFRYTGGTAVTPSDHNYCGLGVTTTGQKGCQFSSISQGVTAQLQHLWSYATTRALPSGWTLVDPRFNHGRRGWAPNWENLGSGNWASASGYGSSIMSIYNEMMSFQMANPKITATPQELVFNVEQNSTSPVQAVTIKGENLGTAIRIASVSSAFKYSTAGWNDYTGGTLNISVDTSKSSGTYTGYIAVESGSGTSKVRVEINITLIIKGPPTINVSPATLSFEATQGDANPTANITVKASDLTQDMVYVSNSSTFTVTPASGWNARTGGTLVVTMDASKSPGTYTGYVAVQTNSSLRKQVDITGVIKAAVAPVPTITANTSAINLSAKKGDAAPTTSVTVTASNLTQDMSFNSSTSAFTITAMPNWNARTGGTLNVTLDTSKDAGTYNGKIVVAAGTARLEIPANGTITDGTTPVPVPSVSVTPASLNLSAKQNATNPTGNVTVSAANLTSDLSYSVSGTGFAVSTASGWNARTGGTLVVTFNAATDPGTYTGTLTVKSGTAQATAQLSANITANTPIVTIPALDFKEIWTSSTTDYRNFDHADGKLYCIKPAGSIDVLDARSGQVLKTLNNGGVVTTGHTLTLCDVKCHNGKIYACNLAGKDKELRVYVWDNEDGTPRLLLSSTDLHGAARLGDCMDVSGSDDNLWVSFANDDNTTTRIVEFNVTASGATCKVTNATTDGSKSLATNSSTRVRRTSTGYTIDGKNILPTILNASGVRQTAMSGESCLWGNDFDTFSYDGKDYMMLATYLNQTSTTYSEGAMRLYDVSAGWDKAVAVANGTYPSNGLGATRNTNTCGALRVNKVHDGCVEAWIVIPTQGMAYYRSGEITQGGDEPPVDITLPNQFLTDWSYTVANGKSNSYITPSDNMTRNMALNNDKLYIVRRNDSDCTIHIVNAMTGNAIGSLSNTGAVTSNYMYTSVANMDGTIIACNMGFSAATVIRVYGWSSDTAEPSLILETTNHGGGRTGDLMTCSGNINNGKIYLTNNSAVSGYQGRILVYNVTNGKASADPSQTITLKKADGTAYDLGATFAIIELKVMDDGTFLAAGPGGNAAWFNADGSFIREIHSDATEGSVQGASASVFNFGKYKLAALPSYKETGYTNGFVTLSDVTDASKPVVLNSFDAMGGAKNDTFLSTVLTKVDSDNKIHIWALIPKQGIAKYTASATSTAIGTITDDEGEAFSITYNGNSFVATGSEVAELRIFSIAGAMVGYGHGNEVQAQNLRRGIYIVAATFTDGSMKSAKVAVR